MVAGMREPIRQFTVIGHQNQTLAVQVKPANRKKRFRDADQVIDRRSGMGFVNVGEVTFGLVQGDINPLGGYSQQFAVNADGIFGRVGFITEMNDLSIDFHPTCFNEFLAGTSRANARECHDFLHAFFH